MADEQPIPFRREALEAVLVPVEGAQVLKLSRRGRNAIFWVLAAAVAAFLVLSGVVHVTRYATGTVVVDADGATALLPERERPLLAAGQPLRVVLDGVPPRSLELVIDSVDAAPLLRTEPPGTFVRVHARLSAAPSQPMTGRAWVPLGSEPLLSWIASIPHASLH